LGKSIIRDSQQEYYAAPALADKEGLATQFLEYILTLVRNGLDKYIGAQRVVLTDAERLVYFKEHTGMQTFTRKDYMKMFRNISTATVSRDLKKGVASGVLLKEGENRLTLYKIA
jgi:cell filamentation protein, protein adenylyltransferase